MANILKPKRSNTAGLVPTTTNLTSGELGVNMADQKMYINNGTSVVQIGSGKLSGLSDVAITSPSSGQSLSYNGTNWVNSSAGTGTVTSVSGTAPISVATGTTTPAISISQATTSTNGYLSSTDWNTFNNKWSSGTALSATTGSFSGVVTSTVVTGTAPFTIASTTLNTNLNADYLDGQHGSYYQPASTAITTSNIGSQSVSSAATLTTGRTLAITGDLTWTSPTFNGSTNVTAAGTLATVNANVGSFGSSTAIPVVTVNAKGLVTAVSTATVAGGQYFGTATTKAIAYNANSISENITVTAGNNGLSAGPITISTGFTVTVETGANWVIV